MPELPEVETIRVQLAPAVAGARVVEAGSHASAKFTPAREVTGATLGPLGRRGKFLLFGTDDHRELIVHLGMTGALQVLDRTDAATLAADPHLRAWWRLSGGDGPDDRLLTFRDVRRFGRIRVVPAGDHRLLPSLHHAGPEPFDPGLDAQRFHQLLGRSRRPIKTRLLSQRPIAGVGNIYADEALWLAGIHPRAIRLSPARASALLDALREVLQQGIDHGGTTLRDYRDAAGHEGTNQERLQAYGRSGRPCTRCATSLRSAVLDARTTTWCPRCQRI